MTRSANAKARVAQLTAFPSSFAPADLAMAEGLEFHWLKAPLLRRGSSSAQGVGGRVRTPAPMAYSEALSFFRRGALCAPAGGQRPPLRRKTDRERWFGKARRGCGTAFVLNFCTPRAQWPGGNLDQPLRFCAPEMFCPFQGVTPVTGSGADSPCQEEMTRRARGGRVGEYGH